MNVKNVKLSSVKNSNGDILFYNFSMFSASKISISSKNSLFSIAFGTSDLPTSSGFYWLKVVYFKLFASSPPKPLLSLSSR